MHYSRHSTTVICCVLAVQHVLQQINNKSKKLPFTIHCVQKQKKNIHSRFLLYLRGTCLQIAQRIGLCEVHSFSTSPNYRQRTTVLNADVPNCDITVSCVYLWFTWLQTLMSVTCGTVDVLRPVTTFQAALSVCVSTDTTTYTATAPNA